MLALGRNCNYLALIFRNRRSYRKNCYSTLWLPQIFCEN